MRIALFVTCLADTMFPQVGRATVRLLERLGHQVVFPDQQSFGTHTNIAGGAVARYAPHRAAAVRFLEYLASDDAQRYFANGNNEWPAVAGIKAANPALEALGRFKTDELPVSVIGANQVKVQQMLDRVGYK